MSGRQPTLLGIVELGGYPNFVPLYRRLGFHAELVSSQRRAQAYLKRRTPDVVVAEFNYQSDFRDRTSNLESLMARLQKHPQTRVIVFYQTGYEAKLQRLSSRFPVFEALSLPVDADTVERVLLRALST